MIWGQKGRAAAPWAVLAAAVALLAGCGQSTVAERLGMGKRSPDEFQVVRRAPLIIPPDYNLRPPAPGAPGPQDQDTSASAEALLTGQPPAQRSATTLSPGEEALLQAGPVQAEPGIRDVIVAENRELTSLDDRSFLLILDFQKRQFEPRDEVVDPVAEAARLRGEGQVGSVVTVRTGSEPLPPQ